MMAVQRGLELVGDVRGELAPELLCPAALRDVEGQQHGPAARDGAGGELVLQAHALDAGLHRFPQPHAPAARAAPGCGPRSGCPGPRSPPPRRRSLPRGRVYAQDPALRIQEDEPLPHAARHGRELRSAAPQLLKLAAYLPLLVLHAGEQRAQLVVRLVLQGVVQVDGVERADDAL